MNKRQIKKKKSNYAIVETMLGEEYQYLGTQILATNILEQSAKNMAIICEDEIEFCNGGNYPKELRTLTHNIYRELNDGEFDLAYTYSITRDAEGKITDKTLYIYQ